MADGQCSCGATWSGRRTAHCKFGGCHQTFSGPTTFDKHNPKGSCLDPSSAGLELLKRPYPCWGTPGDDEALQRLRKEVE